MKLNAALVSMLLAYAAQASPVPLSKRATSEDWKGRTIYQLLTDRFAKSDGSGGDCTLDKYCGGTYKGIEAKLDYITDMGFDAIWISPIPENTADGYNGYWAKDFEKLNENFGSEEDLKSLVSAAHKRGVYVMLDVVANHAGQADGDYSGFTFGSADLYHKQCTIDYDDQNSIEQCWVADVLPDIDTENDQNVQKLNSIVKNWVETYGFDGLRIDTVKHVRKDFWPDYVKSAGVFATGEVLDGDASYVGGYQEVMDSLINYPLYYPINKVFGDGQSFSQLSQQISTNKDQFKDVSVLTNFVDNHDQPRFLNQKDDKALFKNALTFVLTTEGIPVVYYGSEQGFSGGADPANREALWTSNYDTENEFYKLISTVNKKVRGGKAQKITMDVSVNDNTYALIHGDSLVVLNNLGSGGSQSVTVETGGALADGDYTDLVGGVKGSVSGGKISFDISDGLPAIFQAQNSTVA